MYGVYIESLARVWRNRMHEFLRSCAKGRRVLRNSLAQAYGAVRRITMWLFRASGGHGPDAALFVAVGPRP